METKKQLKEMIFFMAKMKYWNGTTWEILDAKDADTIDGKHFTDIQNDAQAKVNTHAALTSAHSATSAATANRIMMRDANGRAKVAVPSASDDIARKDTVDNHAAQTATLSNLGHVKHAVLTATLNTTWSGTSAPYTKTVSVSGILATDTPIIDIVMSGTYSTDEARIEAWGYIYRAVTANGSITFYATEKPTVSLPIQIRVVR